MTKGLTVENLRDNVAAAIHLRAVRGTSMLHHGDDALDGRHTVRVSCGREGQPVLANDRRWRLGNALWNRIRRVF